MRSQLENLQGTVAELLEIRETEEVLSRVVELAGSAVAAQQLLLAVRLAEEAPVEVRTEGLPPDVAHDLGTALVEGWRTAPAVARKVADEVLVADVRSGRRDYGKLVAFSSAPFLEGEQVLLDAYAKLAATTLDTGVAFRAAAARRREAEALGRFAARLIRVQDLQAIADATVDATVELLSTDRTVLFRHVAASGALRACAQRGYDADLSEMVVVAEDTPELAKLLTEPDVPRVYDRSCEDPFVARMMKKADVEWFAVVPIRSSELVFGVITAAWSPGTRPRDDEVLRQLSAIADQAAGAWEKALLLERINAQARLDALTGLANRGVFTELLARLLAKPGAEPVAVLFCDLDSFKSVNDALGHAAGDDLLVAVGRRLQHCVRSDDLVARLGGDEFTILLTGISEEWSPDVLAAKLHQEMSKPVDIGGSSVMVHLSIGATTAAPGTASVKEVLSRADTAMYMAKARGGDRLLMFEESMLSERSERLELEGQLAAAVAGDPDQFVLHYQPQVDMATGAVVGVEALVRWEHPDRGLLAPDAFLPVAEETGHVVDIDLHVLRTALADQAVWHALGTPLRVAVNFSARTLTTPGLVARVEECLAATTRRDLVEFELTESTAVADPESMRALLLAIGDLGVSVAVDDVGTGYSSLALLHRLPAQRLKIDRSFVQQVTERSSSRSVVEAVLLLADRLGQTAIAEGVETAEQAAELLKLGCYLGQGCLFARPVPAAEIAAMAATGLPVAAVTPAGKAR